VRRRVVGWRPGCRPDVSANGRGQSRSKGNGGPIKLHAKRRVTAPSSARPRLGAGPGPVAGEAGPCWGTGRCPGPGLAHACPHSLQCPGNDWRLPSSSQARHRPNPSPSEEISCPSQSTRAIGSVLVLYCRLQYAYLGIQHYWTRGWTWLWWLTSRTGHPLSSSPFTIRPPIVDSLLLSSAVLPRPVNSQAPSRPQQWPTSNHPAPRARRR
jgi:hypothetical protein